MNLANKGRFYHDRRFPTFRDLVNSYVDGGLAPSLTGQNDQKISDLVDYLKSL